MFDLNNIQIKFIDETATRIPDVCDADYFGEAYKHGISNSLLALLNPEQGGSPLKFLSGFDKKKSKALELGSAVHQMILEKDLYFVEEMEKPSGKTGDIIETAFKLVKEAESEGEELTLADVAKKACELNDYYTGSLTQKRIDNISVYGQEYFDYLVSNSKKQGAIILTREHKEKLDACLESAKNNEVLMDLLLPKGDVLSFNEDVMTLDFYANIDNGEGDVLSDRYVLKCKIDNWSIDVANKVLTLNDLKTTGSPVNTFGGFTYEVAGPKGPYKRFEKGSFQKFHYHRQMAMYGFILKKYAEKVYGFDSSWTFNINMLVVETNTPFMSHVFAVGDNSLISGMFEFETLLKRLAFHKKFGFDKFIDIDIKGITLID